MNQNYLTENELGLFLKTIYPNEEIIRNKKFYLGFKPDFWIPSKRTVIEFDGPIHFISSDTCIRDLEKAALIKSENLIHIRLPYFIQLSSSIIKVFFNKTIGDYSSFPHGFINPQRYLPGDYCNLGYKRFIFYLDLLKEKNLHKIRNDILISLVNQVIETKYKKKYYNCFIDDSFLKEIEGLLCEKDLQKFYNCYCESTSLII